MRLILASASPRRAEILRNAAIPFETQITLVDESILPGELPDDYVRRLAQGKARAAAEARPDRSENLFVGADTIVLMANEILGKPESEEDARRMLRLLSGATHEVHTGLAVLCPRAKIERVVEEITRVSFAPISEDEIAAYISTGEPFDKAGGYGIQGVAGRYVTRIEGCYFNVVGLPLARLSSLLKEFGWSDSTGA
ncbi:MAG: Maf family protein [Candidatus Acidiferrales bacterium]